MVVGCGGIGVYLALMLALESGYSLTLVDDDRVEESNLNRQGLFTREDVVSRRSKSMAAADRIRDLVPNAVVRGLHARVDESFSPWMSELQPDLICSAVDNASSRLVLQELGTKHSLPVVQGGTSLHAADCFTQPVGGPTLDEQMQGALTRAVADESARRRGGCAIDPMYVIPGMVCAAMMACRTIQVNELYRGLPPMRWRAGSFPKEDEGNRLDAFQFTLT
jgi:hypothetical protein